MPNQRRELQGTGHKEVAGSVYRSRLACAPPHNLGAGMRRVAVVTSGLHQEMGLEAAKGRAGVIAALGTFWSRKDFRADPRLSEG